MVEGGTAKGSIDVIPFPGPGESGHPIGTVQVNDPDPVVVPVRDKKFLSCLIDGQTLGKIKEGAIEGPIPETPGSFTRDQIMVMGDGKDRPAAGPRTQEQEEPYKEKRDLGQDKGASSGHVPRASWVRA
jgi:hypothetical protein